MTRAQMERAGLLPEQRQARNARVLKILKAHGQDRGEFANALRHIATKAAR